MTKNPLQLLLDAQSPEETRPTKSISFGRNFSQDVYERWNARFDAFFLPPNSPFDPRLPSDAAFKGSSVGFRPIGDGAGGAGIAFRQALGGNVRAEQFTVNIIIRLKFNFPRNHIYFRLSC